MMTAIINKIDYETKTMFVTAYYKHSSSDTISYQFRLSFTDDTITQKQDVIIEDGTLVGLSETSDVQIDKLQSGDLVYVKFIDNQDGFTITRLLSGSPLPPVFRSSTPLLVQEQVRRANLQP